MNFIVTNLRQENTRTLIDAPSAQEAIKAAQAGKGVTVPGNGNSDNWTAQAAQPAELAAFNPPASVA